MYSIIHRLIIAGSRLLLPLRRLCPPSPMDSGAVSKMELRTLLDLLVVRSPSTNHLEGLKAAWMMIMHLA